MNFEEEQSKLFTLRLFNTLKQPPLPLITLRRENIGAHCNSLLQNKLAIMLWEGTNNNGMEKIIDEDNKIQQAMSYILQNKDKFIQEVMDYQNKTEFLENRWYQFQSGSQNDLMTKSNDNVNIFQNQKYQLINESNQQLSNNTSQQLLFPVKEGPSILEREGEDENNQSNNEEEKEYNNNYKEEIKDLDDFIPILSLNKSKSVKQTFVIQSECESSNTSISTNVSSNYHLNLCQNLKKKNTNNSLNNMNQPILLQIMNVLYDTLIFHTKLVRAYLFEHSNIETQSNSYRNGFDLLSEYSVQWQIYVASMYELEEDFQDFFKVFNEAYETAFPNHPSFPKMTPWRMMTKVWIGEVFQKNQLDDKLYGCFTKIINKRRAEIFKYQIKQAQMDEDQAQDYYIPSQIEDITHDLFYNFTKVKKFSVQDFGLKFEYDHAFFQENNVYVDSLLQTFVESIMDLSLNEINVHYLGHSDIQTEYHYLNLEKQFLLSSDEYYRNQENIFKKDSFLTYIEVLEGDAKFLSKILKERTMLQHKIKMMDKWVNLFIYKIRSYILDNKLHEDDNLQVQQENQDLDSDLSQIIYQQLVDIKKEFNSDGFEVEEMKQKDNDSFNLNNQQLQQKLFTNNLPALDPLDIEDIDEINNNDNDIDFVKQEEDQILNKEQLLKKKARIISKIMKKDDHEINQIIVQFYKVQKQIQDIKQKSDQDTNIEELCEERQLPKQLSEMESKFYNINSSITIKEIDEIVQGYGNNQQNNSQEDISDSEEQTKGLKDNLEEYNSDDEIDINN